MDMTSAIGGKTPWLEMVELLGRVNHIQAHFEMPGGLRSCQSRPPSVLILGCIGLYLWQLPTDVVKSLLLSGQEPGPLLCCGMFICLKVCL